MISRGKKVDALQGTLDMLVLRTLSRGAQHGYGIAASVQQVSGDLLRVEEGSLYPALHRMEQSGWIAAEWQITENSRRARYYRLTRAGHARLTEEEAKWRRLTQGVDRVLGYV
jgi:PadR family transcriptional regulator PadR